MPEYQNILITIYNHPEYYPPTLNAIQEFSKISKEVHVVTRNLVESEWDYPDNVRLHTAGSFMSVEQSMKRSMFDKLLSFHHYKKLLKRMLKEHNPGLVVAYDPIALFACYLIRRSNNWMLWYHNHDVFTLEQYRTYSLGWWAAKYESRAFSIIDIFTLPAAEREKYYPLDKFQGNYHVLPNLPGKYFYSQFYTPGKQPEKEIKLLYQGAIRKGHGLEQIIANLNHAIGDIKISLTILGIINTKYEDELKVLAQSYGVSDRLNFHPRISYTKLPAFTAQYDIGLAIHYTKSIQYATGGTASNKIYEYAALGLPVILYDNEHYTKHLGSYSWACFTDLSDNSIIQCIEHIWNKYAELSKNAHKDIMRGLNFENKFSEVLDSLSSD